MKYRLLMIRIATKKVDFTCVKSTWLLTFWTDCSALNGDPLGILILSVAKLVITTCFTDYLARRKFVSLVRAFFLCAPLERIWNAFSKVCSLQRLQSSSIGSLRAFCFDFSLHTHRRTFQLLCPAMSYHGMLKCWLVGYLYKQFVRQMDFVQSTFALGKAKWACCVKWTRRIISNRMSNSKYLMQRYENNLIGKALSAYFCIESYGLTRHYASRTKH